MDFGRAASPHVAPSAINVPFEALARFSLDGLAFIDERTTVVAWNDAAASLTGISAERALGAALSDLFANADQVFARRDEQSHSVRLSPLHEPLRSIDAAYVPVDGGLFITFGPQRRFDAIELVKSEILASVSHELKTPIAVIKAFATTLRERHDATAASRAEYLGTIEEQADTLARSVDELLLASHAQAHDLPVRRVSTPLGAILDEALAGVAVRHRDRTIERGGMLNVTGDPNLLCELFTQLLDNAFAYSGDGCRVQVDAARESANVVVFVRDEGTGIAPDALPYVFERFYRGVDNSTAAHAGTGLGLYVARAIAHAHGGSIAIQSTQGRGTSVRVSLPEHR